LIALSWVVDLPVQPPRKTSRAKAFLFFCWIEPGASSRAVEQFRLD
jgi:hypothetical protein